MSGKNRRVVISLSNFLNDHRSTVLIYLSRRIRCVRDLEEHVGRLFGITDFYFTSGNRYLPSTEDIRILHQEELLKAIPRDQRQEGSQLKPAEVDDAFNRPELPQKAHDEKDIVTVMNGLLNIIENKKKAKPQRDTNLKELPSTWNCLEPRRDFSLEIPKVAHNENETSQRNAEAEMGPSNFPIMPQMRGNFEDQARGTPQSPSSAILEHVFEFLERPEMEVSESNAKSNHMCEQPQPSLELDGGVECLKLKKRAKEKKSKRDYVSVTSSNKIKNGEKQLKKSEAECVTSSNKIKNGEKQLKKSKAECKSIDILENYVCTETENTKKKVTHKRKTVRKEQKAHVNFNIRPVTVKKRKTDLICLDLPKQTNIVKSLIVSDTPKRLHSQSKLEVKPKCLSMAPNTISATTSQRTESPRKLQGNQSPFCNVICATTLQTPINQSNPDVKSEFQSPTPDAISATTPQTTDRQLKLEMKTEFQSPAINTISATTPQTTDRQLKLEMKPEVESPASSIISSLQNVDGQWKIVLNSEFLSSSRNAISPTTSKTADSHATLEIKPEFQSPHGNAISAPSLQKVDGQWKPVANSEFQSPSRSVISASPSQTADSQSKPEVRPAFQSSSRNAVSTFPSQTAGNQSQHEEKPAFQSPSRNAISAFPSQTAGSQSKAEVEPACQSSVALKNVGDAMICALALQALSADQNQSAKHKLDSDEVQSVDKKQLQTDDNQAVVSDKLLAVDQDKKESESSSALLSNSDSDRRSSGSKGKRKRHRKRKAKDKVASQPAIENVYSFKPPSTIAAPSMHIRFDEPDVNAEEAGSPEHASPSREPPVEERQAETNGVGEEIGDSEREMLERVVRQSPRMTKTLPRAGDVVSFKFLRLNVNYEPELSKTVIGKVLSFSADTDQVHMQLISGMDQCQEPDGKFSLEDQPSTVIREKSFPWKSLLESRLLFP